ncbi:hypothetical protein [Actinacidiphila bryophytorum]|uniref:hypothetical protein n=1 Tax=Actinacidiphila bryophytorum TaxID=1436133 RepID=UPI002176EC7E|nr:hypothetical protein [Actinacidiphila bryophytorum]UWE13479.1 hypothetical protein NYE86_35635 [Actinacidiphila bryophytorum]
MVPPATAVRAGAGMRLLRAAVFTAVCVALAAAGHTLASGAPVPVWSLLFGWLAVLAVVAPLAGRERTLPGIAAGLAAGQVALHTVFGAGQMCATQSLTPSSDNGGGLLSIAARLVCDGHGARLTGQSARQIVINAGIDPNGPLSMPDMPGMAAPQAGGRTHLAMTALPLCSLPMLLGHLLAAVVAGWLLRRGEAALWRLVRLSARGAAGLAELSPAVVRRAHALLSALAHRVPAARPRRIGRTGDSGGAAYRTVLLRHSLARRGPPVTLAA